MSADNLENLEQKVEKWINAEGYPLEFRTARAFRRAGFRALQGYYTRDDSSGMPREIDVYASTDLLIDDFLLRVSLVIECKYAIDKPWIIFTSAASSIAPSACIAQTISSKLGFACLWCLAGDTSLKENYFFATPELTGFNAVQAFAKKNEQDRVYSSLQSVISTAYSEASSSDSIHKDLTRMPRFCHVLFPTLSIDGQLFEAHYDGSADEIKVKDIPKCRIHWRGAKKWEHHATVDILRVDIIDSYAMEAYQAAQALLKSLSEQCRKIKSFFQTKKLTNLDISCGSRGIIGIPELFQPLLKLKKRKTKIKQ